LRAAAWGYAAEGEPPPPEVIQLSYIDRFGAQAVLGRPMGYGETQRMLTAEAIVRAYHEREHAASWAAWERDNPDRARQLNEAMQLWQHKRKSS
jgi:hypothetical protein